MVWHCVLPDSGCWVYLLLSLGQACQHQHINTHRELICSCQGGILAAAESMTSTLRAALLSCDSMRIVVFHAPISDSLL